MKSFSLCSHLVKVALPVFITTPKPAQREPCARRERPRPGRLDASRAARPPGRRLRRARRRRSPARRLRALTPPPHCTSQATSQPCRKLDRRAPMPEARPSQLWACRTASQIRASQTAARLRRPSSLALQRQRQRGGKAAPATPPASEPRKLHPERARRPRQRRPWWRQCPRRRRALARALHVRRARRQRQRRGLLHSNQEPRRPRAGLPSVPRSAATVMMRAAAAAVAAATTTAAAMTTRTARCPARRHGRMCRSAVRLPSSMM